MILNVLNPMVGQITKICKPKFEKISMNTLPNVDLMKLLRNSFLVSWIIRNKLNMSDGFITSKTLFKNKELI